MQAEDVDQKLTPKIGMLHGHPKGAYDLIKQPPQEILTMARCNVLLAAPKDIRESRMSPLGSKYPELEFWHPNAV